MDVRNWEFLEQRLAELGSLGQELKGSGFAEKIALTAFFWTLIQYHEAEDDKIFQAGAMSLPDYLTPANRAKVEAICRVLDEWIKSEAVEDHPRFAELRRTIDIGLQATTHPLLEPRKFKP
jgi:hypothetical protein